MRKTYGPLKAKDCKLGASCGGTCIAQTKSCRIGLKPQEKIKVQAAVAKLTEPRYVKNLKLNGSELVGQGVGGTAYEKNNLILKVMPNSAKYVSGVKQEALLQNLAFKAGVAPPRYCLFR